MSVREQIAERKKERENMPLFEPTKKPENNRPNSAPTPTHIPTFTPSIISRSYNNLIPKGDVDKRNKVAARLRNKNNNLHPGCLSHAINTDEEGICDDMTEINQYLILENNQGCLVETAKKTAILRKKCTSNSGGRRQQRKKSIRKSMKSRKSRKSRQQYKRKSKTRKQ